MFPTRSRIFVSQIDSFTQQTVSRNFPEENDETVSDDFLPRALVEPDSEPPPQSKANRSEMEHERRSNGTCRPLTEYESPPPVPPRSALARVPQTPFPSQVAAADTSVPDQYQYQWAWAYPSYLSGHEEGGFPHPHNLPSSLPSSLPSNHCSGYAGADASLVPGRCHSLPGRHSPSLASLEQPSSLLSNPPKASTHTHTHTHTQYLNPYACHPPAPAFCSQCPPHASPYQLPPPQTSPRPHAYYMGPHASGLHHYSGHVPTSSTHSEFNPQAQRQQLTRGTQLSMEQRKVFVTYESDSDDHVKEIIKFVAMLRHNGFDTHIDVFEQQLNSISKIDCTERYIQEKDYLIIIAISPRYFDVVSGDMFAEGDERTLNTVYIHKQLQNEFIQNGCKNFRFIPVLFPGAYKGHIPTWLRNTHVYSWPKDRDDILRRLMRVEKYNPPPIGPLPTIISIPI